MAYYRVLSDNEYEKGFDRARMSDMLAFFILKSLIKRIIKHVKGII